MTKSHSDALALLRARFPESEGWTYTSAKYFKGWRVEVFLGDDDEVLLSANGATEEDAFAALIATWDAATHAEKVRALVAAARGAIDPGCCGEDSAAMRTTGESVMCMNCPHGPLRAALAALPEHWKEGVRGK